MTGILVKRMLYEEAGVHAGRVTKWRRRQKWALCCHKLKNAQPPKTGRVEERSKVMLAPWFSLPTCRPVREWMSVVLSHQFKVFCYSSPKKLIMLLSLFIHFPNKLHMWFHNYLDTREVLYMPIFQMEKIESQRLCVTCQLNGLS